MNSGYHLGALPDGGGKATIARAASFAKSLASLLEKEKVAYDVGAYRDAPPGLRIWCGATVETKDIEALTPWLDFAYATAKADLAKG
jgi:phosphoserine aminotransferase